MYGRNMREMDGETDVVHLRNDYTATAGFHTLCGLCDVPERIELTDDRVDCEVCMAVLKHCLTLAWVRGVIRSMPRDATINRARVSVESDDVPP